MSQVAEAENEEPTSRKQTFFGRFKSSSKPEKKETGRRVNSFKIDLAPVNRVATGFLASRTGTETRALDNDPSTGKKTSVVDSAIYVPVVSDVTHATIDESQDKETPRCVFSCASQTMALMAPVGQCWSTMIAARLLASGTKHVSTSI
jgi:hypothetical protein